MVFVHRPSLGDRSDIRNPPCQYPPRSATIDEIDTPYKHMATLDYDVRIDRTNPEFINSAILIEFPRIDRLEAFIGKTDQSDELKRNISATFLLQGLIVKQFSDYIERWLKTPDGTIAFALRPCWGEQVETIAREMAEWIDAIDPEIEVQLDPPSKHILRRFEVLLSGGGK